MNNNTLENRFNGALLGLAIGDALGAPVEFHKPGDFEPVTDFQKAVQFNIPPGYWTDDTSMALCLAYSLLEKEEFDPVDQIEKYRKWAFEGYCSSDGGKEAFDVGNTVAKALYNYREGSEPYTWAGNFQQNDGNGSLMRIAPIALFFRNDQAEAMRCARLSSKVTHRSELAADACAYFTGLIIGAIHGASKEELLSELYAPDQIPNFWKDNTLAKEIELVARGSFKQKNPPEIKGSGYVVESLEAALWAFYNSETFEEGVLLAVNLGYDADTTGAIYGQLAGAYYGIENIPDKWRYHVAKKNKINEISKKLFHHTNKGFLEALNASEKDWHDTLCGKK